MKKNYDIAGKRFDRLIVRKVYRGFVQGSRWMKHYVWSLATKLSNRLRCTLNTFQTTEAYLYDETLVPVRTLFDPQPVRSFDHRSSIRTLPLRSRDKSPHGRRNSQERVDLTYERPIVVNG